MSKFTVKKDGKRVGVIAAPDMGEAAYRATLRWGAGEYMIRMVREHDEEEE